MTERQRRGARGVVISYIRGDLDSAGIKVWWIVSVSAIGDDERMQCGGGRICPEKICSGVIGRRARAGSVYDVCIVFGASGGCVYCVPMRPMQQVWAAEAAAAARGRRQRLHHPAPSPRNRAGSVRLQTSQARPVPRARCWL